MIFVRKLKKHICSDRLARHLRSVFNRTVLARHNKHSELSLQFHSITVKSHLVSIRNDTKKRTVTCLLRERPRITLQSSIYEPLSVHWSQDKQTRRWVREGVPTCLRWATSSIYLAVKTENAPRGAYLTALHCTVLSSECWGFGLGRNIWFLGCTRHMYSWQAGAVECGVWSEVKGRSWWAQIKWE